MSKKVCHITTVHPPFDTRIFYKECRTLSQNGYDVTLIAQHDRDEIVDGIKIVPLPKVRSRLQRFLGLDILAFWKAMKQRAYIYHFHDPELIILGLFLKLLGKRVIYDVHEDVPRQVLSKYWISKGFRAIIAKIVELIESFASYIFDGTVGATPQIASRFPYDKAVVVQNFPLKDELILELNTPYMLRPNFVGYIGGISIIRGIFEMVRAMESLPEKLNVRLVLAGSFSPLEIRDEVSQLSGWKKVQFLGWLSRNEIRELLDKLKIGLCILHPTANYRVSYPVKLFEYMSAGIPVVASNFPLWKEIVEGNQCGICVDPLNPEEIARAIEYLITHPDEAQRMGENGRKAVMEKYNWESESKKLIELYRKILSS